MSCSVRPTLEHLDERCLLSASAMPSPGEQVALNLQHLVLHTEIIVNNMEISFVQASLQRDQQLLTAVQGMAGQNALFASLAPRLEIDIMANQSMLQALQVESMQLTQLDTMQDADTFPILRALFPGS